MIFAIVAMLVMTMSANAQGDSDQQLTFDRVSSYLELRVDQVEPVKKTMAQLDSSLEAIHQLKDKSKGYEAWQKIEANHMAKMQRILSQNQYDKYVEIFNLTARNSAERVMSKRLPGNKLRYLSI